MEIKRFLLEDPSISIREFAEEYKLIMEIHEYNRNPRYQAHFSVAEISEGISLLSTFGQGETEVEAINDYARKISAKKIIFNAESPTLRLEILVPDLTKIPYK